MKQPREEESSTTTVLYSESDRDGRLGQSKGSQKRRELFVWMNNEVHEYPVFFGPSSLYSRHDEETLLFDSVPVMDVVCR
jgi:hypothetical protein